MANPTDRDVALEALREVLSLCETHPDLPVPVVGDVCLLIDDDAAGRAEIARIAGVLRAAGLDPVVSDRDGLVDVIAGEYRAFHIDRSTVAAHTALMSYAGQVDPATA